MPDRAVLTFVVAIAQIRRAVALREVLAAAAVSRSAAEDVHAARCEQERVVAQGIGEIRAARAQVFANPVPVARLKELKTSVVNVDDRIQAAARNRAQAEARHEHAEQVRSGLASKLLKLVRKQEALERLRVDTVRRHEECRDRRRNEEFGDISADRRSRRYT